ncbi:hypothetical protein FGB62_301g00 [Gracilaria domingensis]|nr:hypothetical protein FGB62_301g00 [Gracilaria domingensis]
MDLSNNCDLSDAESEDEGLLDMAQELSTLTDKVYRRIQQARTSAIRIAYVDLFIGPLMGRSTSSKKVSSLAQEIRSSYEEGHLCGKLLVLGGGHRLLTGARQKNMLLFPYQEVDLSDLEDSGTPLHFRRHEFMLMHHLQASELRPDGYRIMEQVALYGVLRTYWLWKEKKRITKLQLTRPSDRPKAITHRKLYALYEILYRPAKRRRKHAISFLSSPVHKTRVCYMSGADRLLKAKVVRDFCFLESFANTKFALTTLNTVRHWSAVKIRNAVNKMFNELESGGSTVLKFVDDRKKRSKSRGRWAKRSSAKQSPAKPPPSPAAYNETAVVKSKPPVGWEHYMNWTANGDMEMLDELGRKLQEEDDKFKKEIGSTVVVIDDNKEKLQVVENVRQTMMSRMRKGETAFDIAKLVTEEASKLQSEVDRSGTLVVNGGVLQDELKLNRRDVTSITNLSWATPQAVLYTMFFLSNWTLPGMKDVYVLDPVLTQGWWDEELVPGSDSFSSREALDIGRIIRSPNSLGALAEQF